MLALDDLLRCCSQPQDRILLADGELWRYDRWVAWIHDSQIREIWGGELTRRRACRRPIRGCSSKYVCKLSAYDLKGSAREPAAPYRKLGTKTTGAHGRTNIRQYAERRWAAGVLTTLESA